MRKYELMIIFDDEEDSLDSNKNFVSTTLSNNNINIIEEKDYGKKKLAYNINDKNKGHYYLYTIDTDQNNFDEIEKAFKLHKSILKYLMLKGK